MKRYYVLLAAMLFVLTGTGCSKQEQAVPERIKPVRTIEVIEQESPVVLSYSGIVGSGELKKLAFKSTGRISRIHVEKGQPIEKGDMLVELDSKDLKYALTAAKGQVGAAQASYEKALNGAAPEELRNAELNVEKAQAAYDYVISNYNKALALHNSGGLSQNGLEQAKLEAIIKEAELNQAKELLSQVKNGARNEDIKALNQQLEQAKADYEYKAGLLQDAAMISDVEGYVVDIMYKEGELVPAGYPVAAVRSQGLVVNVGLAEKDLARAALGTQAKAEVGGRLLEGYVSGISQIPNEQTRTYNIEIALKESGLNLGTIARVDILIGSERGVWIPLTSVLSDGIDYVYIVKDSSVEKREISITSITGSLAQVSGLKAGEQLVVEGMKRLRAGDAISVLK